MDFTMKDDDILFINLRTMEIVSSEESKEIMRKDLSPQFFVSVESVPYFPEKINNDEAE